MGIVHSTRPSPKRHLDEIIPPDAADHDAQNRFREMRGRAGAKRTAAMYHSAFSDGASEYMSSSPTATSSSPARLALAPMTAT
jgi:hypothetical protein